MNPNARPTVTLIAGGLLVWAALAFPARLYWGQPALVQSATALVICLVPAIFTLRMATKAAQKPTGDQIIAMLGGMGIRMAAVFGAGLALYLIVPALEEPELFFWLWVGVFYLVTLAIEIWLLLRRRAASEVPN